jgi:hypothetical protein
MKIGIEMICFICLNKTVKNICNTCNACAHHKCWETYVKIKGQTIKTDGIERSVVNCPVCKRFIITERKIYHTRSYRRDKFLRTMLIYFKKLKKTSGKENKKKIMVEIFEFLIKNKVVFKQWNKYIKTTKKKLKELYSLPGEPKWEYMQDVHLRLFGSYIDV